MKLRGVEPGTQLIAASLFGSLQSAFSAVSEGVLDLTCCVRGSISTETSKVSKLGDRHTQNFTGPADEGQGSTLF